MLNNCIMMGRLTADPELKQTPSGVYVCSFTIAVDRSFVKQGEERKTDFFDAVAWRGTAEFITRYFHKGQMIAIQGRMETKTYDDKNGVRRKGHTLVVDRVHFADSKREETPAQGNPSADTLVSGASFSAVGDDEDLPF